MAVSTGAKYADKVVAYRRGARAGLALFSGSGDIGQQFLYPRRNAEGNAVFTGIRPLQGTTGTRGWASLKRAVSWLQGSFAGVPVANTFGQMFYRSRTQYGTSIVDGFPQLGYAVPQSVPPSDGSDAYGSYYLRPSVLGAAVLGDYVVAVVYADPGMHVREEVVPRVDVLRWRYRGWSPAPGQLPDGEDTLIDPTVLFSQEMPLMPYIVQQAGDLNAASPNHDDAGDLMYRGVHQRRAVFQGFSQSPSGRTMMVFHNAGVWRFDFSDPAAGTVTVAQSAIDHPAPAPLVRAFSPPTIAPFCADQCEHGRYYVGAHWDVLPDGTESHTWAEYRVNYAMHMEDSNNAISGTVQVQLVTRDITVDIFNADLPGTLNPGAQGTGPVYSTLVRMPVPGWHDGVYIIETWEYSRDPTAGDSWTPLSVAVQVNDETVYTGPGLANLSRYTRQWYYPCYSGQNRPAEAVGHDWTAGGGQGCWLPSVTGAEYNVEGVYPSGTGPMVPGLPRGDIATLALRITDPAGLEPGTVLALVDAQELTRVEWWVVLSVNPAAERNNVVVGRGFSGTLGASPNLRRMSFAVPQHTYPWPENTTAKVVTEAVGDPFHWNRSTYWARTMAGAFQGGALSYYTSQDYLNHGQVGDATFVHLQTSGGATINWLSGGANFNELLPDGANPNQRFVGVAHMFPGPNGPSE